MNLILKALLRPLLPAVITGAVIMCCATAPELQVIPDLLQLTQEEVAEVQDETSDPEEIEEASAEVDIVEEAVAEVITLAQGVGDYTDGVYTGSATGYGGTITVQVTVVDGQITEIEILSADGETASFLSRAMSVIDSILLAQTWEVDAVSGATYSSNGIKAAVQNALTGEEVETEAAATTSGDSSALSYVSYTAPENGYADGTYTGSAQGFGGTITVSVTISDGEITAITIVSASGETSSYLASAKKVISYILSAQSPNVDTVSGATYSSNGIINAVKAALNKAAAAAGNATEEDEEDAEVQDEDVEIPNYGYPDGMYTGTAEGFGGDITVQITVSGGQISEIDVLSAEYETEGFWDRALAVIDSILLNQTTEVDAVSGATYSSQGILDAVAQAIAQATASSDETEEDGQEDENELGDNDDGTEINLRPNYGYTEGTYTGSGEGWGGDIVVTLQVTDGQITTIEVTSAEYETHKYLQKALVILDAVLETQTAEVDTISGATYSSQGILDAISAALAQATPSVSEPDDEEQEILEEEEDDQEESDVRPNYGYIDGQYTGIAEGYDGDIEVLVTVENGQITSVEILSADGETYRYLKNAMAVIDTVLQYQTWEVDAVAGATYSSQGILDAVADALSQNDQAEEESQEDQEETQNDEETPEQSDDSDAEDGEDTSEQQDDETESGPVTTVETTTFSQSAVATVYPDEDEDFDEYSITVTIIFTETITTVVDGDTQAVTSQCEITNIEVSADTSKSNLRYLDKALSGMQSAVIATGSAEVDSVSGATCSSEGIKEAVASILTEVLVGTTQTVSAVAE